MFRSLRTRLLLMGMAIVVLCSSVFLLLIRNEVTTAMYRAEEESARNVLDLVMFQIESGYNDLMYYRAASLAAHKQKLKDIINLQEAAIRRAYERVKAGLEDGDSARRRILADLRTYRFGNNDYVWVADYDSVLISHPDPLLNGRDYSGVKDVDGRLIVPPMVEMARRDGQGFYSYRWHRLGSDRPVEKLAYVRLFPEWKWVLGTGVYLDDVNREVATRLDEMIRDLGSTLARIRVARTGYIYIFDGSKRMLVHPVLAGKDVSWLKNPVTGASMVDELIAAAATPDKPLRYLWDRPDDKGHYVYPKESYVAHFAPLDWYVASSVYQDEIAAPARLLYRKILYISVGILALASILVFLVSRTLSSPIQGLISLMRDIQIRGAVHGRVEPGGPEEIRELGSIFNDMIDSLRLAREEIESRVQQRTAELSEANRHLALEIAAKKEAEQQALAARAEAEAANRAKSEFIATMSHEIRTPLNAIIGMADLLSDTDLSAEQAEYVRVFRNAGETLLNLLSDILDLSKIEAGHLDLSPRDFDLKEAMSRTCDLVVARARDKGLDLACDLAPGVPDRLHGDPVALRQVLVNLVNNAIKFTEHGGVRVAVAVRERGHDHCLLAFTVEDSGTGIPEDKLEIIFDSFRQADSSTTRKHGGTGLGLTISRNLVELMGGTITAENRREGGSRFTFTARFGIPKPPAAGRGGDKGDEDAPVLPPLRILVAEDNEINRMTIGRLLARDGHRAVMAENGGEAVRLAGDGGDFDLALMDIQMPGMDGFEAVAAIRDAEQRQGRGRMPIIAMTAFAFTEDRERCLAAGMDGYVSKPISREALRRVMASCLKERDEAVFDHDLALAQVDGDLEFFREIAGIFAGKSGERIAAIREACAGGDAGRLATEAHTLKSELASLAAARARRLALELERMGRAGEMDAAARWCAALEEEIARLNRAIEQEILSS